MIRMAFNMIRHERIGSKPL